MQKQAHENSMCLKIDAPSLHVYRVHTDSWSRHYDVSDDIMKAKQDTGLISNEEFEDV